MTDFNELAKLRSLLGNPLKHSAEPPLHEVLDEFQNLVRKEARQVILSPYYDHDNTFDSDSKEELLPSGCKYFKSAFNYGMIIIEQKPQKRTIFVGDEYSHQTYCLSFPYVIFIITFNHRGESYKCNTLNVAFRNSPLENAEDELYRTNLPNFEDDFLVCLPQAFGEYQSINSMTLDIISLFWTTIFGGDGFHRCRPFTNNGFLITNWDSWRDLSKKSDFDILKSEWYVTGKNVHDIIKQFRLFYLKVESQQHLRSEAVKQLNLFEQIYQAAYEKLLDKFTTP